MMLYTTRLCTYSCRHTQPPHKLDDIPYGSESGSTSPCMMTDITIAKQHGTLNVSYPVCDVDCPTTAQSSRIIIIVAISATISHSDYDP